VSLALVAVLVDREDAVLVDVTPRELETVEDLVGEDLRVVVDRLLEQLGVRALGAGELELQTLVLAEIQRAAQGQQANLGLRADVATALGDRAVERTELGRAVRAG